MKYPKFLKQGDTIGIFAPSFGANIEPYKSRLESGINKFKSLGYNIVTKGDIFGYFNGASSSKESRAQAFMDLYKDPTIDFIWSVGGGEWMMEMIPHVDFEDLKQYPPKFFMGYSDNTNLTFLINLLLDTVSIYGQNVTEFGMLEWDQSLKQAFDIITGKTLQQQSFPLHEPFEVEQTHPLQSYHLTEPSVWKNLKGESEIILEGRLLGGCLDIVLAYPKTVFDQVDNFINEYQNDGVIWFLEACDLNVFALKRALWQLKQVGWFNNIKGIIFGRPMSATPILDLDQYKVTLDILSDLNIPIIMDVDIGHIQPTMTILSGAYAKIVSKDGKGSITYTLK